MTTETRPLHLYEIAEAYSLQTHRKRAKWLSDYLRVQMQAMGIPKIPGAPTITLIKNSRPSVLIAPHVTTDDLPDAFTRSKTVVEVDKAALTAAYDRGEELPGGISVEIGFHIRIR